MARFSLRKKDAICLALGTDYYNLLVDSLKEYFKDRKEVEEHSVEWLNSHKVIFVPSANPRSEMEFMFIVVSITYDVYNLAFHSSIG